MPASGATSARSGRTPIPTREMVPQDPAVYSQVILFGQDHVSINDDTYTLAPLDSLEKLLP